ncbi:flavodoxin-dependent (E)-4-hydroxy-3-methylbut-2-enyl-diphosphate synthase (plasmid) [Streptomyces murinus]|uniref:flavodoxin-dependent (E)-4-hydroxy-3-methylbut-2-enyl-diphosphate synthase n=1 Tax=Streptomyces murinus TaxID=33900 RepID=UPI000A253D24|nr:flavodoxin-dependent (E)-4-hydroxy-3-methylbut-2-enyl-diphosphate synthase [Streptomyces murinus]WDO11233.1 flavodoxin-dependent (E)-4-hydroxy-3-methylbut-2-enyl-diphosphate synthase [Streptomyces murinus]
MQRRRGPGCRPPGSHQLADQVEDAFDGLPHPSRIAVMGCAAHGPEEPREADPDVSCGNNRGQNILKGKVVRTVLKSKLADALLKLPRDLGYSMVMP